MKTKGKRLSQYILHTIISLPWSYFTVLFWIVIWNLIIIYEDIQKNLSADYDSQYFVAKVN